jgi:hypothetical protein
LLESEVAALRSKLGEAQLETGRLQAALGVKSNVMVELESQKQELEERIVSERTNHLLSLAGSTRLGPALL